MRKLILMPVMAVLAVAFKPSFAQVNPPLAEKAVQRQVYLAEAFPGNLTGEVVSADYGARRMTVKQSGSFTPEQITFAVAEPVAAILGELQPGDRVTVGYVRKHGHLIAMAIRKVPAERGAGQQGLRGVQHDRSNRSAWLTTAFSATSWWSTRRGVRHVLPDMLSGCQGRS